MKYFTLLFVLLSLNTASLGAQRISFKTQPADCDIRKSWSDNPLPGVNIEAPRIVWHLTWAIGGRGISFGVKQITSTPDMRAEVYTSETLAFGPHILGGVVLRNYPINLNDWKADGVIRQGPVVIRLITETPSVPKKIMYGSLYLGAYLLVRCDAYP